MRGVESGLDHRLGHSLDFNSFSVVDIVVVVDLEDVEEGILSVLQSLPVIEVELLDARKNVANHFSRFICEGSLLTVDGLDRYQGRKLAEKLV